jgi:hypothetical protein
MVQSSIGLWAATGFDGRPEPRTQEQGQHQDYRFSLRLRTARVRQPDVRSAKENCAHMEGHVMWKYLIPVQCV